MSLADGSLTGVEALLRWKSAELGEISPAVFVPLAEESGLILTMGEWVVRAACAQLKDWRRQGFTELSIGINVSVLQLLRGNLPVFLSEQLRHFGLPAERVELEVTESMRTVALRGAFASSASSPKTSPSRRYATTCEVPSRVFDTAAVPSRMT